MSGDHSTHNMRTYSYACLNLVPVRDQKGRTKEQREADTQNTQLRGAVRPVASSLPPVH